MLVCCASNWQQQLAHQVLGSTACSGSTHTVVAEQQVVGELNAADHCCQLLLTGCYGLRCLTVAVAVASAGALLPAIPGALCAAAAAAADVARGAGDGLVKAATAQVVHEG